MTSLVGQTVSHYSILEKLGEGGMGIVYKAEDTKLKRIVALKFLPRGLETHEPERARFLQEAQAAAALNHPNICTIHDIAVAGDQQFIVMEHVEGKTLREFVPVQKMQDAVAYAIQIAEALHEAHSHGIVHRDIKAENIMVNTKNQVKVMDFGLAKLKGSLKLTKTSSTVGTLAYMAPEQIQGEAVDARSDIFSFGAVLYEMLTGHLPFRGEHEGAMVYSIVNEDPEPLESHRSDLPPVLVNLIQRALEKSPADRYQSAEEMAIELRRLQKKTTKVTRAPSQIMTPSGRADAAPTVEDGGAPEPRGGRTRARTLQKKLLVGGAAVIGLLIVAAVLYQFVLRKETARGGAFSLQSMKVTRLTSAGNARSAVVSPDGKYVVYSILESGRHSLWVRQVATTSNVQIIPPAEVSYFGLAFSGDGNYVYYCMNEWSTGLEAVYRIPVLGGSPRKILDHVEFGLSLSPDDKEFAFVRYLPTTGEFCLMLAKTDGTDVRTLVSHKGDLWFYGQPAWSPDGKMIACGLGSYEGGIHTTVVTVDVEGAAERHITPKRWMGVNQLAWLPDGSGILVRAGERGSITAQLFELSYPAGEVARITNDLLDYASLSLAADGRTLCVVQGDFRCNIMILPAGNSARAQQVTHGKDDGLFGMSWAPDGRIVYGSSASGSADLWIMDRNGQNKRQLTADVDGDYAPVVSPDGTFLLFGTTRSGVPNIWRIGLDGSNPIQLTTNKDNYNPSISPDGTWFAFDSWATGVDLIMRQPTAGGDPVQLSETHGSNPAISPDGKLVAFIYLDEVTRTRRIVVIPAEGGNPLRELDLPHTAKSLLRWSPDGTALQFITQTHGASNIWSQPISGGPPRQLTHFTSDYMSDFGWWTDGTMLAVARYSVSKDVLLMSAVE